VHTLAIAPNGVILDGMCEVGQLRLSLSPPADDFQASGTVTLGSTVFVADTDGGSFDAINPSTLDFDGIARRANVGSFDRIDVHGEIGAGDSCPYWGMIVPSS
jgi:hypothetical protein